jgi:hypothetical protein
MATLPSVRLKFRETLEGKLDVAAHNNPKTIASWELSSSLDRVTIVCTEEPLSERVIEHIASSVTRLLGVGKRLDIVDRTLRAVTVECLPQAGNPVLLRRVYAVD